MKRIHDQKLQRVLREKRTAELSDKPAMQFKNKNVTEIVVNYSIKQTPPERIACFSSPKADFLAESNKHLEFKELFIKLHDLQQKVQLEPRLNWWSLCLNQSNNSFQLELRFSCPASQSSKYEKIIYQSLGSDPNIISLKLK